MISIMLPGAVVPDESVTELWNKCKGVDNMTLARLAGFQSAVCEAEDGETYICDASEAPNNAIWGAEACAAYCGVDYKELNAVEFIDLPAAVHDECTCPQWADLSGTLAAVERCTSRISWYSELGFPGLLIRHQYVKLKALIEQLIGTSEYRNLLDDVTTLKDIGYSLSGGWSEEAEARRRGKYAAFMKEE